MITGGQPDGRAVTPIITDALKALSIEAAALDPLASPQPFSLVPRTFRVLTADGRRLKLRVAQSVDDAARAIAWAVRLADPRIPVPVARVGQVTVETWIDGTPLSDAVPCAAHLDEAAAIFACIHACPIDDGVARPALRSTRDVRLDAEAKLAALHTAGSITAAVRQRVQKVLDTGMPPLARWGLIHGDLCAPNIVCAAEDGRLVCVDNEMLRPGFVGYDVARTWYRWPMDATDHARFAATDAGTDANRQAWRVIATVRAAHLRLSYRSSLRPPLTALTRALQAGRG